MATFLESLLWRMSKEFLESLEATKSAFLL